MGGALVQVSGGLGGRTGRNRMDLETGSQITSHCNGNHSGVAKKERKKEEKKSLSLSPTVSVYLCLYLSPSLSLSLLPSHKKRLSQYVLCNSFKVYTKFSLEGAE